MDPVCAAHPGCVEIAAYILAGADDSSGRGETLNFLARACCPTTAGEILACCTGASPSSGPTDAPTEANATVAAAVEAEGDPLPSILAGGAGVLVGIVLIILVAIGGYLTSKWQKERQKREEEEWRQSHSYLSAKAPKPNSRHDYKGQPTTISERSADGSEGARSTGIAPAAPRDLEASEQQPQMLAIVPAPGKSPGGAAVPAPALHELPQLPGALDLEPGEFRETARPPGGQIVAASERLGGDASALPPSQACAALPPVGAPPPLCGSPPNTKGTLCAIGVGGFTGAASSSSGTPSTQASTHASTHVFSQASSSLGMTARTSRDGPKPRAEPPLAAIPGIPSDGRAIRCSSPGLNRNGLCSLNLAGPLARPSAG